jgi:hypothetical protein
MKKNEKKMNELDELPQSLIDAIDKNLAELPKSDLDDKLAALYDAYDLAMLAADVCRGVQDPDKAIKKAWALLKAGELHLRGIALEAKANSPQAEAEWREQEEKRLAATPLTYEQGVKCITGYTGKGRWGRALEQFEKFLAAKAKKERKPEEREAWVEAKLTTYRVKGFTGTEAKKLQEEYRQWRGYRGQGRVKKQASDGRLKANRQTKLQKQGKEAWTNLTKPKLGWEAVRGQVSKGRKTPNLIGDAAPGNLIGDARAPEI